MTTQANTRRKTDEFGRYRCIKCKTWKHPGEFYYRTKKSNRKKSTCKACDRARNREIDARKRAEKKESDGRPTIGQMIKFHSGNPLYSQWV